MENEMPRSMTPNGHAGAAPAAPDRRGEALTVGRMATLVGISVRTLHHWDAIGLVRPSERSVADYRIYAEADVDRVHRVLVYRELGLPLAQIAALLDDPDADEAQQLREQRRLLGEQIARLGEMARAVDRVLAAREAGTDLSTQERAKIFGQGWREDWDHEAQQRWGASEQWAQFDRSAADLSSADRDRMRAEGERLYTELAAATRSGVDPTAAEARRLAEAHRVMIGQLFDCTPSMHVCLGRMYVGDERFSAYFDGIEPGLSTWLLDAIEANARDHGVDPDHATWE